MICMKPHLRTIARGFVSLWAGIVAVVAVAGSARAEPVLQWHVGHGTDREEHVHEGVQTSDGGYVAIGHTQEASGSRFDMLIVKTDASGNQQWQTRVGGAGEMDVGLTIAETSTGYVAGGGLFSGGQQSRALVGLDVSGNVVWQKTYPGGGAAAVRGIDVLPNGDVVATGYLNSGEDGFVFLVEGDTFLMKTDPEGNLLWDRSLDGMQGTKVRQEPGGGLAVLSAQWVFAGGVDALNVKLIRTDASGETTWSQTYGGENHIAPFDFDLTDDGGFIVGGHTTGYGVENWDCLLMKIDASGNESWHRIFGQPRGYAASFIHDECYGVRQDAKGGYVLVGGTGDEYSYSASGHPSGPSDEWKAYLIVTDGSGNVIDEAVFGDGPGAGNNAGEYLTLTDDGCYMIFTDTDSAAPPEPNNFGFMKICGGSCGDGVVDEGEQCDDGGANGGNASCCAANCNFKPDGAASCDGVGCTKTDTCSSGVCTPGSCATGVACGCGGLCSSSGGACGCGY